MNIKAAIDQAMQDCTWRAEEAASMILSMPNTHANKMRVISALIEAVTEDNGTMDYTEVIERLQEAQEALTGVFAVGGDK